jgi:hypothetical protein
MFNKLTINISKYFFLVLFLVFFGSITFFNHSHIVNGITIVHSHPFKSDKNGQANHIHSGTGFLLINFLANFIATSVFALTSLFILLKLREKLSTIAYNTSLSSPFFNSNPLRGPPQGMLI